MIGRIHSSSAAWGVVAAATVLLAPTVAQACPVCMGGAEEDVRTAFIVTTAFLTVCPLLMVGGLIWWLRRTFRAADQEQARVQATVQARETAIADGPRPSVAVLPATAPH